MGKKTGEGDPEVVFLLGSIELREVDLGRAIAELEAGGFVQAQMRYAQLDDPRGMISPSHSCMTRYKVSFNAGLYTWYYNDLPWAIDRLCRELHRANGLKVPPPDRSRGLVPKKDT